MDFGVLETAVTLGLLKLVCGLLCFPTLRDSFNSVGFCCSCLLIFTDLSVTVFLTLLWLAKPWQPHFLVPSDVIVPRLLLFLGHTYGAATLLTAPLIAVDTACRLRWPLDGEKRGGGRLRTGDPVCLNSDRGRGQSRGVSCDSEVRTETARGQSGSLMHLPGFLCCLLVWTLCGCGGERDWRSEGKLVEACLQTGDPLSACLPSMLAVTLQTLGSPSRTLAMLALSLVLALNMGVLRGGWGQGGPSAQTDERTEVTSILRLTQMQPAVTESVRHGVKTHGAHATYSPSGAHATYSPSGTHATYSPSGAHATYSPSDAHATYSPSGAHATYSPSGAHATYSPSGVHATYSPSGAHATYRPSGVAVHSRVDDGQTPLISLPLLTSAHHRLPSHSSDSGVQGPCDKSESAPLSCWDTPHDHTAHTVPKIAPASSASPTRSPARFTAALDNEPRPRGGGGRGSVILLTGLACAAALCLLPPAMGVNAMSIRTAERLAEWSLRRVPVPPQRYAENKRVKSEGETKETE